jgi:hypothetical protein
MEAADTNADAECMHGMVRAHCSICRVKDGYRADSSGRQRNDCTILTVQHLTGAEYSEAQELLEAAGKRKGAGSTRATTTAALSAAGWETSIVQLTPQQAQRASESGRSFWVSAQRRGKGHAWAIVAGEQHNEWTHGFRYIMHEVK